MESLPQEIALDILARLPITSLMQFKCVCKVWYSLAQDPHLPLLQQARSTMNNPLSCLILHSDHTLHDQLHLIDDNGLYSTSKTCLTWKLDLAFKSMMPNFDIAGSCNGFLCLSDSHVPDSLYIYNPLTQESIKLPPTNKNFPNQRVVFGFGFHPTTKEYKVIRTIYCLISNGMFNIGYARSDTKIYTVGARDDSWRSLGKAAYWLDRHSPTALVNGAVHWLTQRHKYRKFPDIVSLDLATEVFDKVPGPSCETFRRRRYNIVELGGFLCAVVRAGDYREIEVWVMKEYNVKESWTKEFVIPAHVPVGLNPDVELSNRMRNKRVSKRSVRVLGLLKTGEILLEYENKAIVSYDPEKENFKDLNFHGLPNWLEAVAFMGNLLPFQAIIGCKNVV